MSKPIFEMNRREVVELYLSEVELSEADELYMWEHSSFDIDEAAKCENEEELEAFLKTIESEYVWKTQDAEIEL